jgi:hypothetical protein
MPVVAGLGFSTIRISTILISTIRNFYVEPQIEASWQAARRALRRAEVAAWRGSSVMSGSAKC